MSKPTNLTNDSFKHFSVWLAALFLVVLGAKWWVVQLYGSPLPLWDQWYEAATFFRPWKEGQLTWGTFFAAGNEHRILFTRLLDMGVIELNGRWEPLVQMTVNAFLPAAFACGLAGCFWHLLGRKDGWLVCFLLAPFFALPYTAENTIWAINSQVYFLGLFFLPTLAGLGFSRPGNWRWWLGLAAAILGLFTMASGLIAPAAVGGLVALRAMRNRQITRDQWITLGSCLAVFGLGAALSVQRPDNYNLRAHSVMEFATALARNLSWPFFNAPALAFLLALPLLVLLVWYLRRDFPKPRAAEFLLAFALWGGMQSAILAYGRANYGDVIPASRYLDVLNVPAIGGLLAAVLFRQLSANSPMLYRIGSVSLLVLAVVIFGGLVRISQIVVQEFLTPTRMMTLVAEERVTTLWTTGGTNAFFQPPTIRPSAEVTLSILRDPNLQSILPAVCLPPASPPVAGRFGAASESLLQLSTIIEYGGLGLFLVFLAYGLVRDPAGLAWKNIPAFAAVLALLAALGFVWSKAPITRTTVECTLQYKLAEYFNSAGNPERAAIHEQKAEALDESRKSSRAAP